MAKTSWLVLSLTAGGLASLHAEVVAEFDVATGADTPLMASPPWTLKGEAMESSEGKLVQHLSPAPEGGSYSHYVSPELGGLIGEGTKDYGIEFKIKPLGDIPKEGNSNYANLLVAWSDNQKSYNVTIDASIVDASEDFSNGGLNGAGNQMVKVAEDIDWTKARTIFIGYEARKQIFHVYVDGEEVASVPAESLASDPIPEFFDRVIFGDTTSGQGNDVKAEWSSVRILTEAKPSL